MRTLATLITALALLAAGAVAVAGPAAATADRAGTTGTTGSSEPAYAVKPPSTDPLTTFRVSKSITAGRPVTFTVTLSAAEPVTIDVLRWQPASGTGKHRVAARYVQLIADQFDCEPGPNLLEITRVHGAKFTAGRYELIAVERGHRHVAAFTVTATTAT